MRFTDYNATAKTLVASSTLTFNQQDLVEPTGLVALHCSVNGGTAGNFFGATGIETIRVKADGAPIIEASYKQLGAWIARLSRANYEPAMGSVKTLTIPLYIPDQVERDAQDQSQFPAGKTIQVEFVTGAGVATAPTLIMGWTKSDVPQRFYPTYLRQFLNWTASSNSQRYTLSQEGLLRGLAIPARGIGRFRVVQNGASLFHMDGPGASGDTDLLSETQIQEGNAITVNSEHTFLKLDSGLPLLNSYLEADLGADWQTASPENEVGVHTLVPYGRRAG